MTYSPAIEPGDFLWDLLDRIMGAVNAEHVLRRQVAPRHREVVKLGGAKRKFFHVKLVRVLDIPLFPQMFERW